MPEETTSKDGEGDKVFKRLRGDQVVTRVAFQGQECWLQRAGETARARVYGDLRSQKFLAPEKFQELMRVIRKHRKADQDERRRQRRQEQQTRWPGLGRIQREPEPSTSERVGHRPDPKTAPPVGSQAYAGG